VNRYCEEYFTGSQERVELSVAMIALPTSIEIHLKEAGFTATELLVLRILAPGCALTLRQIASRTGKSTGVLDQASKKLLGKRIITKKLVNGTPKYMLMSSDSIIRWIKGNISQQFDQLKRKEQDVSLFFSSLNSKKDHPEVEYFEGLDGIKQAYSALLERSSEEMLHYLPVWCKEEDDPINEFRKKFCTERKKRGVFSRIVAHDTVLGRRFQSRDPFEHRKTLLVPEQQHPFCVERIIAGDTFAYFHHEEQKACLMKFMHLAASERAIFESVWECSQNQSLCEDIDDVAISALEGAL